MKHKIQTVFIITICFLLIACNDSESATPSNRQIQPIINVIDIAGQTKNKVNEMLGKPSDCYKITYGEKCLYSKGQSEIVFIHGKADWITINNMGNAPYSKSALAYMGLEEKRPYLDNPHVIAWRNIRGLRDVRIFPGSPYDSSISYAYIRAKTE